MSGLENSSSTKDEHASHGGFNHYEFASYTALQCILSSVVVDACAHDMSLNGVTLAEAVARQLRGGLNVWESSRASLDALPELSAEDREWIRAEIDKSIRSFFSGLERSAKFADLRMKIRDGAAQNH